MVDVKNHPSLVLYLENSLAPKILHLAEFLPLSPSAALESPSDPDVFVVSDNEGKTSNFWAKHVTV